MAIHIEPKSETPVFQQVIGHVKAAIARGAWRPDELIPSVRQMAATALVNPNTIAKAYRELEREGIIYTRRGLGVFVAEGAQARCRKDGQATFRERLQQLVKDARGSGIDEEALRDAVEEALSGT